MENGFRAAVRRIDTYGVMTFPGGDELLLTAEDIVSWTMDEGSDDGFLPGSVLSAQLTLELDNAGGGWLYGGEKRGWHALRGAKIRLYVSANGDARPCGDFTVLEASAREHGALVVLTGSDSIGFTLDGTFTDDLRYPTTLETLWRHWVVQSGFTWTGTVPNGSMTISNAPDWGGASLRRAAGWIAQAAGCFIRLDREGSLMLCPWKDGAVYGLDADGYCVLTDGLQSWGPIRTLTVKGGASVSNEQGYGEQITVEQNPLLTNALQVSSALNALGDLRLNRLSVEWPGDPSVAVGTHLTVADTRGRALTACVTRQRLRFQGRLSASTECAVPEGGLE